MSSLVALDEADAAGVLRHAFALVCQGYEAASDLHDTLLRAAGPHLEAFDEAAMSVARVLGIRPSTNMAGGWCLDRALAAGSEQHGAGWPTRNEALAVLVQALAAL